MENHGTLPFVLRGNRKESRLQLRRSAFSVEGGHAGVNGACTQILLNAEQLVVLGNALGAAGGTGLDLVAKTPAFALSWWLSGLSYDAMHGVGNFVIMLLLYRPLRRALQMAKRQIHLD